MNHIIEQELGCIPCYNFDQNERNNWKSLAFNILQTNSKDIMTPNPRSPIIKTHLINQSDSSLFMSPFVQDMKLDHNQTLLSERSYATPPQDLSYKDDSQFISVDFFRLGKSRSVDRNQKFQKESTEDISSPAYYLESIISKLKDFQIKTVQQACIRNRNQLWQTLQKAEEVQEMHFDQLGALNAVQLRALAVFRRQFQNRQHLQSKLKFFIQRKMSYMSKTKQLSFQELPLLMANSPMKKSFLNLDSQFDTHIKSCLKISDSSHNFMAISQEPSSCQSFSGSISLEDIKEFPQEGKGRKSTNSIKFVEVVAQQKKNYQNMNIYIQSLGLKNLKKQKRLKPISLQRTIPTTNKVATTCETNNRIDSVNLEDRLEQKSKIKITLNSNQILNFKVCTQESTSGEKREKSMQYLSVNGHKQFQKSNERKQQKQLSRSIFNVQSNDVCNNKKRVIKISQFASMSTKAYQSTKINLAEMKKIFL